MMQLYHNRSHQKMACPCVLFRAQVSGQDQVASDHLPSRLRVPEDNRVFESNATAGQMSSLLLRPTEAHPTRQQTVVLKSKELQIWILVSWKGRAVNQKSSNALRQ